MSPSPEALVMAATSAMEATSDSRPSAAESSRWCVSRQACSSRPATASWARGRRRALTDTLTSREQRLRQTEPAQVGLDADIDRLARQVAHHTRQRLASDLAVPDRARPDGWDLGRAAELAWPRPADAGAHDRFSSTLARPREPYRGPERDHGSGLSR